MNWINIFYYSAYWLAALISVLIGLIKEDNLKIKMSSKKQFEINRKWLVFCLFVSIVAAFILSFKRDNISEDALKKQQENAFKQISDLEAQHTSEIEDALFKSDDRHGKQLQNNTDSFLNVLAKYKIENENEHKRTQQKLDNANDFGAFDPLITDTILWTFGNKESIFHFTNDRMNIKQFSPEVFNDIDFTMQIINRHLFVNISIRDVTGDIIAIIYNNEWLTNKNKMLDKNYDKNGLEIIDNKGKVVLQINYDGKYINIAGVFYKQNGTLIALCPSPKEIGSGSIIKLLPRKDSSEYINAMYEKLIEPIFKYPSELHRGERVK